MNSKKYTYSLDSLPQVAADIIRLMHDENIHIITLQGSIGAGKTSLVRTILQQLGVDQPVSSPTFSYINVYTIANGRKVYHFDLYRLSRLQQFYDAGFDEYLEDDQAIIFIEWPELLEKELHGNVCKLMIEYVSSDKREITFNSMRE